MKTRLTFLLFISIPIIISLIGCDKHYAKKLSGTYSCKVDYHYMDITPTSIDSTYFEDIEIKQDGKNVIVLGNSIHVDSLRDENEYYEGNYSDYFTVQFKGEEFLFFQYSGGQGGNSSLTYHGIKM